MSKEATSTFLILKRKWIIMTSKENIYSSIQNLYNMDKNTWQEVLAELYNLIYQWQETCDNLNNTINLMLPYNKIVLIAPNNKQYKLTVDDDGNLSTELYE